MLNLLRFAEGGRASYEEYHEHGVPAVALGRDQHGRAVADVQDFGPDLLDEGHDPPGLRTEGLEEAVLQATVPLL